MVISEIKKIDSSRKKLKEFGISVGAVLVVLGDWILWRGKNVSLGFILAGGVLAVLGLALPAALKPLQKLWMTLAILMGWVMTRLILSILFFLVLTPISFLLRLTGKDILDIAIKPQEDTYWKFRPKKAVPPSDYEKQF